MSKVILEFDGIEEAEDARTALDGYKWKIAMWGLDQWLRSQTKYAPEGQSEDTYQAFEKCRDMLHEIVNDNNISLD